jgi:hypothetical protein
MEPKPKTQVVNDGGIVNVLLVEPEPSTVDLQDPKFKMMHPGSELRRYANLIFRDIFAVFGVDRKYIFDVTFHDAIRKSRTSEELEMIKRDIIAAWTTNNTQSTAKAVKFKKPWTLNFLDGQEQFIGKYDCIYFIEPSSWKILFGPSESKEDALDAITYRFVRATKPNLIMMILSKMSKTLVDNPNHIDDKFNCAMFLQEKKLRQHIHRWFNVVTHPNSNIVYLIKAPKLKKPKNPNDVIPPSKKICKMIHKIPPKGQSILPRCRRLRILSGPFFLEYHKVAGRKILLLGENHAEQKWAPESPDTQEIHSWLAEMGTFAPECIDIMVEHTIWETVNMRGFPSRKTLGALDQNAMEIQLKSIKSLRKHANEGRIRSALNVVQLTFAPCEQISRLNCYGKRLRYTNIDPRKIFFPVNQKNETPPPGIPLVHQFDLLGKHSANYNLSGWVLTSPLLDHDLFDSVCRYVAGSNDALQSHYIKLVDMVIDAAIEKDPTIIATDLSAQKDDLYMREIIDIFKKTRTKVGISFSDEILNNLIEISFDYLVQEKQLHLMGFFLQVFMVDYYSLLRLFTLFDADKMNLGPPGCADDRYRQLPNVIFYTGAGHSHTISQVLKTLGHPSIMSMRAHPKRIVQEGGEGNKAWLTFATPFDFWSL